jgi:DNA modification methylase
MKPTAMLEGALTDLTDRGEPVLDPFLGSGSTLTQPRIPRDPL